MKAILLGLLSALFFSVTFILNRSMELSGGHWAWSASLRYFFMLPILVLIVFLQGKLLPVLRHLRENLFGWIVWSTVGFGFFYTPIAFATVYGPGWLVAATFQMTIIAGSLLVPLLNQNSSMSRRIPLASILISLIILFGVFIMQLEHASTVPLQNVLLCVLPLIVAAFAYPLGNRKMMHLVGGSLSTIQRVLGMTIASMPLWIILAVYGTVVHGLPSSGQVSQSFIVAVSSGVIATVLFFYATELVKDSPSKLAGVEATQSGEVLFALLGEMLLLHTALPSSLTIFGMILIIFGMILHSLHSAISTRKLARMNVEVHHG
ncbi:multidrug resistance efflux transporter family protein [Salinicoccus cyprini]|uniref:Multidrug resistance efflux transporter family protein n=1 Tax=Salinicoccus cyprini TaxID=2493691 RepID=A0A558ARY0_9STAP|nr:multidrug resistance efflux transporter family protein [Salinicoccus cyprini]TVT27021.1 multidrug resistance efflux transporter family protein [Salinicoccus cyprini]